MNAAGTPATTDTAPEPDLEREIHYALRAESLQWHAREGKPRAICWPLLSHFRMFLLPIGMLLVFAVLMGIPMPKYAMVGMCVVIAAVVMTPLLLRGRREKRDNEQARPLFPATSDQRFRLRVAGPPGRLQRLREAMERETDEFEPRLFRVARPRRPGVADWAVMAALFCVLLGALVLLQRALGLDARFLGQAMVFASLILTVMIWAFMWPMYLRFAPGRLDILSYRILGRGRPEVRSIDLRSARILVTIPGTAALFVPDEPVRLILDVGPVADSEPLSFERAVLAAARSSAPSPPLPDDELVG